MWLFCQEKWAKAVIHWPSTVLLSICTYSATSGCRWSWPLLMSGGAQSQHKCLLRRRAVKMSPQSFSPPCVCVSLTATFIYSAVARKEKQSRRSTPSAGRAVFLLGHGGCDGHSPLRQDGLEVLERLKVEKSPFDFTKTSTGVNNTVQIICGCIEIESSGSFYWSISFFSSQRFTFLHKSSWKTCFPLSNRWLF